MKHSRGNSTPRWQCSSLQCTLSDQKKLLVGVMSSEKKPPIWLHILKQVRLTEPPFCIPTYCQNLPDAGHHRGHSSGYTMGPPLTHDDENWILNILGLVKTLSFHTCFLPAQHFFVRQHALSVSSGCAVFSERGRPLASSWHTQSSTQPACHWRRQKWFMLSSIHMPGCRFFFQQNRNHHCYSLQ